MSRDQTHRLTDRRPTRKLLRHPSDTRNTVCEIQFRAQQTVWNLLKPHFWLATPRSFKKLCKVLSVRFPVPLKSIYLNYIYIMVYMLISNLPLYLSLYFWNHSSGNLKKIPQWKKRYTKEETECSAELCHERKHGIGPNFFLGDNLCGDEVEHKKKFAGK